MGVVALAGVLAGVAGALLSEPALFARAGFVAEEADPTDTKKRKMIIPLLSNQIIISFLINKKTRLKGKISSQ